MPDLIGFYEFIMQKNFISENMFEIETGTKAILMLDDVLNVTKT